MAPYQAALHLTEAMRSVAVCRLRSLTLQSRPSEDAIGNPTVLPKNFIQRALYLQSTFGGISPALAESHSKSFHKFNTAASLRRDALKRFWNNCKFRAGQDPRLPNRKKIVVLGTGWGAMQFVKRIDVTKFDVIVISPRNFFAFTPLLPSVAGGALTARSCLEPVRDQLFRGGTKVMDFYEAFATEVDPNKKVVHCTSALDKTEHFTVDYDKLVIAVGASSNTFNTPGAGSENVHFLREVEHARRVRNTVINNFETAQLPGTPTEEKARLLHFVIIGGGPTGVETAGELADFLREDAPRYYPEVARIAKITLIEQQSKLLPTFGDEISKFAIESLRKQGVQVMLNSAVASISPGSVTIVPKTQKNGTGSTDSIEENVLPCGMTLWASGSEQSPLTRKLVAALPEQGGSRVLRSDERLRVIGTKDVYALGDCTWVGPTKRLADSLDDLFDRSAASIEGPSLEWLEKHAEELEYDYPQIYGFDFQKCLKPGQLSKAEFATALQTIDASFKRPPPTAQNATQAAKYLATVMNNFEAAGKPELQVNKTHQIAAIEHTEVQSGAAEENTPPPAYIYRWRGSFAYVGDGNAVIHQKHRSQLGGKFLYFFWKLFYWNEQLSTTNRVQCAVDWIKTAYRGRDVGREFSSVSMPAAVTFSVQQDGGNMPSHNPATKKMETTIQGDLSAPAPAGSTH